MNKKIYYAVGAALILAASVAAYFVFRKNADESFVLPDSEENNRSGNDVPRDTWNPNKNDGKGSLSGKKNEELIQVSFPTADESVGGMIYVSGIARGGWYFEADFPVRLFDKEGNELASAPAYAQGEWMTENFVPFLAALEYRPTSAQDALIVLERNNPSDLDENDRRIEIPVKLVPKRTSLKVFFGNSNADPNAVDCAKVFPVGRAYDQVITVGRASLEELLKGVTEKEGKLGYSSSINSGVKINNLTITDGVARVDFNSEIEKNVGGSCRVTAIRSQIEQTLKQFPTVESVIISVNGRTEDALQP